MGLESAFRYIKRSKKGLVREIIVDPFAQFTEYENPNLPLTASSIVGCWKYFLESSDLEKTNLGPEIPKENYDPMLHIRKFYWDILHERIDIIKIKIEVGINIAEQQKAFERRVHEIIMNSGTDFKAKEQLRMLVDGLILSKGFLNQLEGNVLQKEVAQLYIESYSHTLDLFKRKYPNYFPSKNISQESITNPYPNIFSNEGYELFRRVVDENSTYQADDFAYLFREMTKDNLIYPIKQNVFKDFVYEEYGIRITKIKTLPELKTSPYFRNFYSRLKTEITKS